MERNMNTHLYTVIVEGDEGDGDYITNEFSANDADMELLIKFVEVAKPLRGKFLIGDRRTIGSNPEDIYPSLTTIELERLVDMFPSGDHGIHRVRSIKFAPIVDWVEML
jgi:hypothetical protein